MDAIIYTSESGFTRKYARMLSKELGVKAYELRTVTDEQVKSQSKVIYLGWLMAGKIHGFKKALKKYDIQAVCAVGMSTPNIQPVDTIKKQNKIEDLPVFYLQGGYNNSKLHGIHKFMMKCMEKTMVKKLMKKPDKTEEESAMLETFLHGADFVSKDKLKSVLDWAGKQKGSK